MRAGWPRCRRQGGAPCASHRARRELRRVPARECGCSAEMTGFLSRRPCPPSFPFSLPVTGLAVPFSVQNFASPLRVTDPGGGERAGSRPGPSSLSAPLHGARPGPALSSVLHPYGPCLELPASVAGPSRTGPAMACGGIASTKRPHNNQNPGVLAGRTLAPS